MPSVLQHDDSLADEQLSLQHVIDITPYVKTAKNKNFHTKFNLSFSSIIKPLIDYLMFSNAHNRHLSYKHH